MRNAVSGTPGPRSSRRGLLPRLSGWRPTAITSVRFGWAVVAASGALWRGLDAVWGAAEAQPTRRPATSVVSRVRARAPRIVASLPAINNRQVRHLTSRGDIALTPARRRGLLRSPLG